MENIDVKYEVWKNKLLDLGKRNRLLNYRDTARSTIKITYPECSDLYDMFVKNETPLIFPIERDDEETQVPFVPNVETNKNISDLQKALRILRNKSKTAIEEQGVNVLYLSFGFLNWTEDGNSNYVFSSPLILVPVTLTVESITSPYCLRLHEDEIVLNPTLTYKLENDFGISLPSFEDVDSIDAFLEEIKIKTSLKNWSVSKDVGLSMLSFLKINMYADLNKHKETIVSNPIVRAISGDITAVERIPDDIIDFDFDKKEKPVDVFQVVDADASQQDAILMAKRGVSFVLQGPPGTGKSQTITNIIAESLADGKKVLFVSEKMAALDVVHRRLTSAGLDDFCLVLHSYKANKKSVLEQLGKVLNLSQKKASLTDEAYQKLDALQADKTKLNDYANQVYKAIQPLGKSIYEANGIVANLESYDDFIFAIDNIRNVTKEQYNKYGYLLSQFATTVGKMTDDYKTNPWRNCHLLSVSNEFRHDVNSRLGILMPKIKNFDDKLADIFVKLHLDTPHTIESVKHIINILAFAKNAKNIPSNWILTDEAQSFFDEISECTLLKEKHIELLKSFDNEISILNSNGCVKINANSSVLNSMNDLTSVKIKLENILTTTPYKIWCNDKIQIAEQLLIDAINISNSINSLKNELLEVYESEIFTLDYKAILSRIKTEYTSFTKVFKKEYKQDKKSIQALHKDVVKKITDEEMLLVVEKLRKIDETKQWYDVNSTLSNTYFEESYFSENTDYVVFEKHIATFKAIKNAIGIVNEIASIYNDLSEKEYQLKEHYQFLYSGIMSDWNAIKQSLEWAVEFKNLISNEQISETFVKAVCQADDFLESCHQAKESLEELIRSISYEFLWFVSNFDNPKEFEQTTLINLYNRLNACANGLFLLEEWIDFSTARTNCINGGLKDFIRVIELNNIPVQNIMPVFKKRFFRLWLDAVLPEYPAVSNFRRKMQETTISEFSMLDKVQFEIAKARIRSKLINDLPSLEHFTTGVDEISILKKELSKQRRIMPIRRLFKAIPNLLLTLKPCLMMSPLSVSLFLEAETYKFDIVIFDEASQVCTENAIGAISRAKQVVIAGDSKQLPPTNFFQAAISEGDFDSLDDDDEFDDSNAYESILDEANMLPERTLRWHYRSRHEGLIAFSNAKIYNNNLVTFPQ